MRTALIICTLMAALVTTGCDPGGLRRVQLQLPNPSPGSNISLDSPDTKEALQILDSVFVRQGFALTENYTNQLEHGYIRLYSKKITNASEDGQNYARTLSCHVKLTSAGIFVTFGEPSLGGAYPPQAEDVYEDVTSTFIKRYGKKAVRSRKVGFS